MSFPKYPKYKDSGVEWLGNVPAHWNHGKVRYFAKLESGHTPSRNKPEYWENCTVPWFTLSDVWKIRSGLTKTVYETKEKVSELGLANSSARLLPAGTVILSRTASVGYSAILGKPMATTQDFANWICGERLCPEYLLSVFRAMKSEFSRMMMGSTHKTIYMPDIAELYCAIPPMHEQSKIISFLDYEAARIDSLVEEQQRLIELLKEKRQAVISHAVTKGLDPDVPMKNSGLEWLGKVPAHWNHGKIRYFAKLESGHTPSRNKPEYWENCTIPWFTLADVWKIRSGSTRFVYETKEKVSALGLANSSARLLPAGTVILSRTASVGYSAILGKPMATTQDFANWVCREELQPEYLLAVFRSMKSEFSRMMMGSTHKTIYMPDIAELYCAVPPITEQAEIVAFLDKETARIDALVEEGESAIKLLQERRSALISAAVTGKIDVRGWQPPTDSTASTEATQTEMV
ncbi:restriction endonuclease subunit S [Halomonas saccharevitans]|uniref:Restriction endonuclease subunit S n=1 Tax=Halomonas saccharevitans TaxID=416872 RepID=A0ABU3NI93_9GAMM|nr:restriction endonuclease subunit S [Halomonas saccharevitans]MDT8880305.1 restriction endonuclease subunit S [Halomonas saccharevitans]